MNKYVIYDIDYEDYLIINNFGVHTFTYTSNPCQATLMSEEQAVEVIKDNSITRWKPITIDEAYIQSVITS